MTSADSTREITREMELSASPERVFRLLHTPSDLRGWWKVNRAIVRAEEGGDWAAVWGDDEDSPDFITFARIGAFEPPRRMLLTDYRYSTSTGPLPFDAEFGCEFVVTPTDTGCTLRVINTGFPTDPVADEFYAGCEKGWKDTFDGIRWYLEQESDDPGA